jgi:hypothetical protein
MTELHHILEAVLAFIGLAATKLINWFDLDFWECFFVFLCTMFVVLFARMDKRQDNSVDLADLLVDSDVGKVTIKKLGALVALATSTWWTAKMAGNNALTIEFAGLYILTWTGTYVGMPVASAYADKLKAQAQSIAPAAAPPEQPPPANP